MNKAEAHKNSARMLEDNLLLILKDPKITAYTMHSTGQEIKDIRGNTIETLPAKTYYRVTVEYCDGFSEGKKVFIGSQLSIENEDISEKI